MKWTFYEAWIEYFYEAKLFWGTFFMKRQNQIFYEAKVFWGGGFTKQQNQIFYEVKVF